MLKLRHDKKTRRERRDGKIFNGHRRDVNVAVARISNLAHYYSWAHRQKVG